MADVLRPVISGNEIKEGSVIVGANKFGDASGIPPAINFTDGITQQSGILQNRFDDTGVYGGTTATSP
jgi:hypothetical protein